MLKHGDFPDTDPNCMPTLTACRPTLMPTLTSCRPSLHADPHCMPTLTAYRPSLRPTLCACRSSLMPTLTHQIMYAVSDILQVSQYYL